MKNECTYDRSTILINEMKLLEFNSLLFIFSEKNIVTGWDSGIFVNGWHVYASFKILSMFMYICVRIGLYSDLKYVVEMFSDNDNVWLDFEVHIWYDNWPLAVFGCENVIATDLYQANINGLNLTYYHLKQYKDCN